MGLVITFVVLALIFGGVGLFVSAAKWALIIAAALLVTGVAVGAVGRGRTRV